MTDLMPFIISVPMAIQEAPIQSWTWMIIDESGILEEIEITHFPDGREIDVQSILSIITNILKDCVINPSSLEDSKDDEAEIVDEVVQHEIHKLSPKLAYLSSEDVDVHAKTIDVFKVLSNYPWEAKLTLALAALVTNYGEYWAVAQSNSQEELTKMMKFLRQMGENPAQQSRFDVLHALIESVLDMIKGILKIKELMLLSADETTISIATTIIVIASYWTLRSIVISVPYIHSLFAEDYEPSASKESELVIMTRKIRALLDCLQDHQERFGKVEHAVHDETDDAYKMQEKQYREMLCGFEEDHADNMWILNLLFNSRDNNNDLSPIVDCSTNQRVDLESLKKKNVVLMISSGIDISKKMLHSLAKIWNDMLHNWKGHDEYRMIWFPIAEQSAGEWTESMQHKFEELRSKMPFYSTNDPRCIDPTVIKFVKHKFHFKKHTILVVMDGVGKILHYDATHMIWTWGVKAFPLTVESEAYLWRNYEWDISSLFWGIDDLIIGRRTTNLWVIGGDDMELIKRLESKIKTLDERYGAAKSSILYVGKSTTCKERDRNITWEITGDDKEWRHSWEDDDNKQWLFWTRIESTLLSVIHLLANSGLDENEDDVAKALKKLLSSDKNRETWVIYKPFSSSPSGFVIEDGLIMLEALSVLLEDLPEITEIYNTSKFIQAFEQLCQHLRATSPSSHAYRCSRIEFGFRFRFKNN